MCVPARRDPANHALFLRILQAPVGVVHALRRMNDMSILGRYLPNFRRIPGCALLALRLGICGGESGI